IITNIKEPSNALEELYFGTLKLTESLFGGFLSYPRRYGQDSLVLVPAILQNNSGKIIEEHYDRIKKLLDYLSEYNHPMESIKMTLEFFFENKNINLYLEN